MLQIPDFAAWTPGSWEALGTWVTAGIAAIAGLIAFRQVREARRLREEQSQPYVVAYMESSSVNPMIVDLVIRNFGNTAAHNVSFEVTPELRRAASGGGSEPVWIFSRLPVLVPGQEWRTTWDFGPERAKSDLPDQYVAVVSYENSRSRSLPPLRSELDWGPYKGRHWVVEYGLHDAAKALREINKKLAKWQESIHGGLAVFVRDGDAKDQRNRERQEELLAQRRRDEYPGGEPTGQQ